MAKNKSNKKVEQKPSKLSGLLNGEPMTNLFIKLVLVIVISSLFLVSLIYITDRLWSSEPYLPPLNSSVANEILKMKNPEPTENLEVAPEIVPGAEDAVMCTMEYMPVCAWQNNGMCSGPEDCPRKTYGNKCVADAAHANIISEGECQ